MNTDIDHIRLKPKIVPKKWGHEEWIYNEEFCGKILYFNKGGRTHFHAHVLKYELFRILRGLFEIVIVDTSNGKKRRGRAEPGDIIFINKYLPHQIICLEDGELLEVSTHHEDSDSYYLEERID